MTQAMVPAAGSRGAEPWPLVARAEHADVLLPGLTGTPAVGAYLVGQAGVGKTVLARQIAAAMPGHEPVAVIALAELGGVPLGAWAPTLASRGLPTDPTVAVAALVADLGARSDSVVLMVDDAPRLDEVSAAVVYQLARGFGVPAILTARAGERPPAPVRRLLDEGLVLEHVVEGLGVEAVGELLERRFGALVRHSDVLRLRSRTDGNPLYLRALVEAAARDGAARVEHGAVVIEDGRTPPQLLEAVVDFLATLDVAERRALHLVVLTQPVRRDALVRAGVAAVTLDGLEAGGVLSVSTDGALRVAHPLLAEALERDGEAPHVRRDAIALLRADDTEAARFAACCVERSGGVLDDAEAAWAADYALATGDLAVAANFAELAATSRDGGVAFGALMVLAVAASLAGDLDGADGWFDLAEARASAPAQRARLAARRGEHLAFRRFEVSAAIEQAEAIRAGLPPEFLEGADADLRLWRAVRGEAEQASASGADLGAIPPDVAVRAAMAAIMFESMAGRVEAGGDAEQVLVAAGERLGRLDPAAATMVGFNEYIRLLSRGTGEAAARLAAERRINAGEGVGLWTCTLAEHRNYNGRLHEAGRLAALAADQLRWRDGMGVLPLAVAIQADVAAKRGDADQARALLASLSPEQRSEPKALMVVAEAEAWLAAASGDVESAAGLVEDAATHAIRVGFRLVAAISLGLCVRLGVPERAADILEDVCSDVPTDFGLYTSLRDVAVALRDRRPGDVASPAARLAEAGMPPTALDAISLALRMGPGAEHRRKLERLVQVWVGEVDAPLLQTHDAPLLTAREHEVARRAARRERSREIAVDLGLSVSTVNNQLQSAYRKLGVSSRDELRTALEELGMLS